MERSAGVRGLGVAGGACVACCTPLIVGFVTAASATAIAVTLLGVIGLAVVAFVLALVIRDRRQGRCDSPVVEDPTIRSST